MNPFFTLNRYIIELSIVCRFLYFLSTGCEMIYKYVPKAQQVKHVEEMPEITLIFILPIH
jgi:hypothetical protein